MKNLWVKIFAFASRRDGGDLLRIIKIKCIKSSFMAILVASMLITPSLGFGISGAVFKEEVSPGQKLVHEITVSSSEDDMPLNMTAEVYGFAMNQGGANIELSPEEDIGSNSARPFLSVEPRSFTLDPGERERLLLTGTVPEDVGSGGRYALVTITTAPEEAGSVMVSTAIQVLVLLTIKDSELFRSGKITDLAVSMNDDNVSVDLVFENTGNVHYKPLVGAALKGDDGEILAYLEPTQIKSSILPTNSRLCRVELVSDGDLLPGNYTLEATVTLEDGTVLDARKTTFQV